VIGDNGSNVILSVMKNRPVVGVTAAVHGNELNGVPCIHRVASQIDVTKLKGTVVAVPCVNVIGYLKFQREYADGRDLNRHFPGKEDGFASQVYCFHLMHKILSQFNYMIDLHTASFGRVNSYYVRADMVTPYAKFTPEFYLNSDFLF
jgi:predicted deacylase